MEETKGLTIKGLLIRLLLIIVFIFLLIWLFPMPNLKPLNNQIFADNIDRMKNAAKSYYTVERLPEHVNDSKRMTLAQMIDNHLVLELTDSNGKVCSKSNSYVEITKLENEYIIKVFLSCSDKQDYIIEHFGCYDICSDKCKALETTTTSGYASNITKKKTTKKLVTTVRTTKNKGKVYEYQYSKNVCTEKFDKYTCPSGYYLVNDTCFRKDSETITVDAKAKTTNVTSTDTKDAKAVVTTSTTLVDATKGSSYTTSTITAGYKKTTYTAIKTTGTQKVTADKTYSYDVKGAVETTSTSTVDYTVVQNYDIISADKITTGADWTYVSTKTSTDPNLAFVGENEKLVLIGSHQELACDSCASQITVYTYWRYKRTDGTVTYSCANYPGYSLYDGNKCRKATTSTKTCPSGYKDTGSNCKKTSTSYSCSKYGSDYDLDSSKKTCTKTSVKYSCPKGTTATSDEKYCNKKVETYSCASGQELTSDNTCVKYDYFCPANTDVKTYTLNGNKCTVKTKVDTYTCPSGTVATTDKTKCAKTDSKTTYTCDADYKLNGTKCTKTITTTKTTYTCDTGYTINGTKCTKTVSSSDSKAATKAYKSVCNIEYKWSTRTSLPGWTYTGNKREVK